MTRDDDWEPTTLHAVLDRGIATYGASNVAFSYVDEQRDLTLGELRADAERWAVALAAAGVDHGDRVAVLLQGHSTWPTLQVACSRLGAVLVGVNTRYRSHEIDHLMTVMQPSVVVSGPTWRDIPFVRLIDESVQRLLPDGRLAAAPVRVTIGADGEGAFVPAEEFLAGAAGQALAEREVTPDDIALIQFTSGSTGAPKGVRLSHDAVLRPAHQTIRAMNWTLDDVVYSALPFYHVGGSVFTGPVAVLSGARMVVPDTFGAREAVEHNVTWRCNGHQGHAAMYTMFLDAAREAGALSDLRIEKAWAVAPPSVLRRIAAELRTDGVVSLYGMSEHPLSTICGLDEPLAKRFETVGRPAPDVELRIDADGPDGVGEIQLRGPAVMSGYHEDEAATRDAFTPDGWLHTGDLGTWDPDGYVVFAGRLKDMLKPGGENVSAQEVEEFLMLHPGVVNVAVFGVPDDRLGEAPVAVVQARSDADLTQEDLLEFCRDRIAGFKTPKRIHLVPELPLLPNGKLDKVSLRSEFS
ncbi:class I adenylate-forming enzyme family protein [Blastococcus tunisiensis]|uniref:Fatty-acyl-CoA synthase n=1 Tax=Blastococcus tunisiensis TaxID=1798228 RepID=A0A1I1ZT51_9ACTN|nr:class I adenylate-forming enzyme family protein [Blastococcus sp. DSM 46838]SFE34806.1 fatty-acyl-CoA synthase [Blastococcus sp. DSM 46838]